jgi:hypothetical protein
MTTPEYELLSKLPRPAVGALRTNLPVVEESEASAETAEAYQLSAGVVRKITLESHRVDQAFKGLASRMAVKGYIR